MTERYGDYELVRYLTAGGMADLYLAKSPRFPGELVIKKIQPRYLEYTRVVRMFVDEARIAQALSHPNIVKIVEAGQQDGTYFIAMEYIPGRDLLAVCRRGVEVGNFLPRHLAVAILEQALRGLEHAHDKRGPDGEPLRVVHCDVSPGNIVVSWGGTAKMVDFGIARATIQLRAEDHTVAGKYNYMAPEQIRGAAVDARADLFALGVIMYELTVGKRLFRGRPEQVMRLVLEDEIPKPSALRPDFPPELEAIVMRALERDPERRWSSARELRAALRGWLRDTALDFGKREVAAYLRTIFGAEKQREADEFTSDHDDEDLVLERALPVAGEEPLTVDAEDPDAVIDDAPASGVSISVHGRAGVAWNLDAPQKPEPPAHASAAVNASISAPAPVGQNGSPPVEEPLREPPVQKISPPPLSQPGPPKPAPVAPQKVPISVNAYVNAKPAEPAPFPAEDTKRSRSVVEDTKKTQLPTQDTRKTRLPQRDGRNDPPRALVYTIPLMIGVLVVIAVLVFFLLRR